uniref:Uncharacterized protein n=1 Tax=Aegilops tauschii TaxID=37682 RepID=M8BE09_AEGTA
MAQLAGVDAYGLITMIVEAARTVRRNRETCQLLARRVKMIGDLLQQLESTQLMQHLDTRNPVEQLETVRHTYMLIRSCQDGSYLYSCFMGGKQADQLHQVQNEITFYLQLPSPSLASSIPVGPGHCFCTELTLSVQRSNIILKNSLVKIMQLLNSAQMLGQCGLSGCSLPTCR